MSVHMLRVCHDTAMDLVAIDDQLSREVAAYAAAAIIDALDERVSREDMAARLTASLKDCCRFQQLRSQKTRGLCAHLEALAALLPALSVKELAAELRPHLAVIGKPGAEGTAYVQAVCAVRDIAAATPRAQLTGGGMQRALGRRRHNLLMNFAFTAGSDNPAVGTERERPVGRPDRAGGPNLPGTREACQRPLAGCAGGEVEADSPTPWGTPRPRRLLSETT
jgi:hypothetical protein